MESAQRKLLANPRESANFLSVLFFWWTLPIFKKGYSKILDTSDVYEPRKVDRSDALGGRLERQWQIEYKSTKKPSLMRAITKTFWKELLIMGALCFINDVAIRLIQPFILGSLLTYFRKDSTMSHEDAMQYGTWMILLSVLSGFGLIHYFFDGYHYGMKVRVAMCSVIYKKALRLSQTALGDTAPGKIVNLLSNDVNRFDIISVFVHPLWTSPLMTIAAGYILWQEIQWAGMIGIAIVFVIVPIQSYAGKLSAKYRFQTALRADERVRLMDEIISGVQVIKMYAWERSFASCITMARRLELSVVLKNSYVRALYMTFNLFTTRMALFCTLLSIVLLYGSENITVAQIFVVSALFNAISHAMCQTFVRGIAEMGEALVAFRRLQTFLEYEEKSKDDQNDILKTESAAAELKSRQIAVSLKTATARWTTMISTSEKAEKTNKKGGAYKTETIRIENNAWRPSTLHDITIEIPVRKLIGVIGPVGAGKSSFLQVLLRELPLESGSININGSLSYASQEPWVFAATARQNIIFGQKMDNKRYQAVVKATALREDFEQFQAGDLTMIGERGISLSGGQKARINLARAVYRKANIYLLDDPLSAVDAHVGLHLFNECIGPKGYLAHENATRILITHQVHFLKEADWIVILRDGKIETQGSYNDILNSGVDFANILAKSDSDDDKDELSKENDKDSHKRFRTTSMSTPKHTTVNGSAISLPNEKISKDPDDSVARAEEEEEESELLQLESSSKGKIKGSLLFNYFKSAGQPVMLVILITLFILAQIFASGADIWVSYWTREEELRTYYSRINETSQNTLIPAVNHTTPLEYADSHNEPIPNLLSTNTYVYIYAGIMVALFVVAITRSISMYRVCAIASQNLHDRMFNALISTTMRFFDTNPSGRIMNRFSKDMGATDEALPKSFLDAAQINLSMIGAISVTIIANAKFAVIILILAILFVYIRKFYLKSSKNIKRLEGMTKSPVFTHISATLSGLSTIRAFDAEDILQQEFDRHQDLNTACWYMFIGISSGFGVTLDIMSYIFITCVTFFFLLIDTDVTGDKVGLAITQSLTLTGLLQWGIRQSAEVTNQLMAVERILEYSNIEAEKQPEQPLDVPSLCWPTNGKIEFKNVFYRYFPGAEPVLRNLTFLIQPKEKIGIVGRTGAGKSSLIASIFRLACVEGNIIIDEIDTAQLALKDLRSKIAIIPQDPVLFSGTLRRNLDPFNEYYDADIWSSLENVELKEIGNGPDGLQTTVMARGCNFSVGQRQLLCLARAILRKNQILVLDEATANVDPRTDQMIQQTIREKFADCTVLTVAHRLHTIIDSDRVLVMDGGVVIEFDKPYALLTKKGGGAFRGMVEALGAQEFERLFQMAKEKFKNSQNLL